MFYIFFHPNATTIILFCFQLPLCFPQVWIDIEMQKYILVDKCGYICKNPISVFLDKVLSIFIQTLALYFFIDLCSYSYKSHLWISVLSCAYICANPISVFLCQVVCIFVQIPSLSSWMAKSDARRCSWPRKSVPVSNVTLLTCHTVEEYNNQYNNSTIRLFSDPHNFYNSCVTSHCLFTIFTIYSTHIVSGLSTHLILQF